MARSSGSGLSCTKQRFFTSTIPGTRRTIDSARLPRSAEATGPPTTATRSTTLTSKFTSRSTGSASRAASADRASTTSEMAGERRVAGSAAGAAENANVPAKAVKASERIGEGIMANLITGSSGGVLKKLPIDT